MSTTVQVNGIPTPRVVVGESGSKIVGLLITGAGGGTVTSFSATPSGIFDVANATTTPALSLDKQNANIVLAGPTTGSADTPGFRSLVAADIPDLSGTYLVDADIGVSVQAYHATLAAVAGGTYTGDDSIATVGTVTSGTWKGTVVGTAYGGLGADNSASTGVPVFATGSVTITATSGTGNIVRASLLGTMAGEAKTDYAALSGATFTGAVSFKNLLSAVLPVNGIDSDGNVHFTISNTASRGSHSGAGPVDGTVFMVSAPSDEGASAGGFSFYPGPGNDAEIGSGDDGGTSGPFLVALRDGGAGDGAGSPGDGGYFSVISVDASDTLVASLFRVDYDGTVTFGTNTLTVGANSSISGTAIVNGGALGTPSSGTLTNCTFPTLNQNTTGSAATLTTTRTIGGSNFNGSANVTSFPSPGAIGGTTPAAGTFTTLVAGSTTSLLLGTAGSAVGNIGFRNATSGTATLAPPTGALGTYTVTLPNAASTLPIFGQQVTFSGPTAARTVTFPDANFTAARTDAANTFTGVQTFSSAPTSPGSGANTERWGSSAATGTATNATALGNGASVSGDYGTAIGRSSSAGTGAVAIGGFATASGTRSFCLAYNSTASHQDSYVFGSNGGVSYQNAGFTFHAASGAPVFIYSSYDDTSVEEMAAITTAWVTSTHASRKGRITLSAYDTAIREGFRVEASGSAPAISFYGDGAVVRGGAFTITAAPTAADALNCDANGGAYSGVPGSLGDAATLADLNDLRADVASLAAVVRKLIALLGTTSGVKLIGETGY